MAAILAQTGIRITDHIPFVTTPEITFSRVANNEISRVINDSGILFWMPIVNFFVLFCGLVLPTIAGIAILMFAEKQIFPKQAVLVKNITPVWLLCAVALSLVEYSYNQQTMFVYFTVLGFGAYSVMYQLISMEKKSVA